MNSYQRVFGAGPKGVVISLALLAGAWQLEPILALPNITDSFLCRWSVFIASAAGSIALLVWSVTSLPPENRGRELVTTGAFRYFRHPLYAAFLSCFNLGLAVLFNNWIYLIWAILIHVVWHWIVASEEKMMREKFPQRYETYCKETGRFLPRINSLYRDSDL